MKIATKNSPLIVLPLQQKEFFFVSDNSGVFDNSGVSDDYNASSNFCTSRYFYLWTEVSRASCCSNVCFHSNIISSLLPSSSFAHSGHPPQVQASLLLERRRTFVYGASLWVKRLKLGLIQVTRPGSHLNPEKKPKSWYEIVL